MGNWKKKHTLYLTLPLSLFLSLSLSLRDNLTVCEDTPIFKARAIVDKKLSPSEHVVNLLK